MTRPSEHPPRRDGAQADRRHGFVDLELSEILASFAITRELLESVARLRREGITDPVRLVEDFYRWLSGQAVRDQFFPAGVPDGVRRAQVQYWKAFLEPVVDESYVASRLSVGATHARIDLSPRAYTTSMAFSQRWIVQSIVASGLDADDKIASIDAVSRLCQFDSALVMDAYGTHSKEKVQFEARKLATIHEDLQAVLVAASEGNFDERYVARGDEDSALADAVNSMVESLASTVRQAKSIADGNYSLELRPRSSNDELGIALAEMTSRLREAQKRTQRDRWLKSGQADLFEEMRGDLDVEQLADRVLSYIARRVDAPVACLYHTGKLEGVAHRDPRQLRLVASYGCPPDTLRPRVAIGEGILGEAARSARTIWDLDVSSSPVHGTYGLGELTLTHVSILPLVTGSQLRGVLQFATLEPVGELFREFLAMNAENIAIALAGATARAETQFLLQKSRDQQEELHVQAAELRATNEELEEREEALIRIRSDLEEKNAKLEEQRKTVVGAHKELEKRASELAQASKYKSEFLANMSHELRTPLNSMLLLSDSLLTNREGNLSARQLESIAVLHEGGQELLRLIEDILDLSKVEAGYLAVHPGPVDLAAIANSLRVQFAPIAEAKAVAFELEVEEAAPKQIVTDRHRLEQILKNLLSNAFKFTEAGKVTLRFARCGVGAARITVEDTGIGITDEQKATIFEAFQQADGSTSRRYGGTGLGLTISRELARLLHARISVQSEVGVGSRFELTIPCAPDFDAALEPEHHHTSELVSSRDAEAGLIVPVARREAASGSSVQGAAGPAESLGEAQLFLHEEARAGATSRGAVLEPVPSASAGLSGRRVLVVDDDARNLFALTELLQRVELEVVRAQGGSAALELLAGDGDFDLLITDIMMPEMDGLELIRRVRAQDAFADLPIIALTARTLRADREACLEAGASDFLTKPLDPENLLALARVLMFDAGSRDAAALGER